MYLLRAPDEISGKYPAKELEGTSILQGLFQVKSSFTHLNNHSALLEGSFQH
jgi:hypothetical protein